MKWTKIKTLMLCFLLVMNLFMLTILAMKTLRNEAIPQRVVNATLSVLKKSGFEISEEDFPDSYYTRNSYKAQFYSASDLSELFFGKQLPFRTVDNYLVASDDGATLIVDSNNFHYETEEQNATKKTSSAVLKHTLKKKGFDMEGAVYDKEKNCFYKMYNDSNLFNMSLEAKIDTNGEICYVKAQWPKTLISGEKKKISFLDSTMKLRSAFPNGGKIQNIELGYSLHQIGENKFQFIPAWRVMVNDELRILE